MIKVLDSNLKRLGVIKRAISASWTEVLNGENTLDFEAVLDGKLSDKINEDSIYELNNQYFDTAFLSKKDEDDIRTVDVEGEHVSYRLNDPQYDVESFTEIGTPDVILGKILEGTPFTVGVIESTATVTYSAQEPKSRRQLLMEFVATIYGEVIFDKFTIGIVNHRGSNEAKKAIKGRNVNIISKTVNKREFDEDGAPIVSYICNPVYTPEKSYQLGDDILVTHELLDSQEKTRLVSLSYNPYDPLRTIMQFTNYSNGLESELYRIETEVMVKDKHYNGIRIGPKYGFEAIRNDKRARAYFRSDGLVMQSGDGTGRDGSWKDRLYYDYDSDSDDTTLVFDGKLSADLVNAISGMITPYIYAENGLMVNAVVRRLRTDLSKPFKYLSGEQTDIHFQDIGDTDELSGRYFEVDYCKPEWEPIQFTIPSIEGRRDQEIPLWWFEGVVGGAMTTSEEYSKDPKTGRSSPVMVYQYDNGIIHRSELKKTPAGSWGIRDQWGGGEDAFGRGSGIIEKTNTHMQLIMDPGTGAEIGGVRVSTAKGVELYNPKLKTWEYPGGIGDFDALEIEDLAFTVTVGGKPHRFDLMKDVSGRIKQISGGGKHRTVTYK